jgi:uncharacterized membrane protein (UPF0127 family)
MQLIKDKKKLYFTLVIMLLIFGGLVYYSMNQQDEVALKALKTTLEKRILKDIKVDGKALTVEIANSRHKKQNGLKFRKELPENEGMLFLFGLEGFYNFWLKDTLIPLDIIWIDRNFKIVYIVTNAESCITEDPDECEVYTSPTAARYVIEVNSGWTGRNGVNVGDSVEIDGETREELEELEVEDAGGVPFF